MEQTIVNAALVEKIDAIVNEWNAADRVIREQFAGWQKIGMRAGLERAAKVQIAKAAIGHEFPFSAEENGLDAEGLGEIVLKSWQIGNVQTAMQPMSGEEDL